MALLHKSSLVALRASRAGPRRATRAVAVRAEAAEEPAQAPAAPEAAEPVAAPEPVVAAAAPASATYSFDQIMGFGGWAPEVVNGRAAMLAWFAGMAAEICTGESFAEQFSLPVVVLGAGLVTAATFMPTMQQTDEFRSNPADYPNAAGPFTADIEKLNGRMAMVGLLAVLATEGALGHALL